jgi:hypothetical protein
MSLGGGTELNEQRPLLGRVEIIVAITTNILGNHLAISHLRDLFLNGLEQMHQRHSSVTACAEALFA